ncbi:MAG TPA: hypothetical protein VGQ41_24300 [Pyrinomonadaceae bacterium]|jgi:hypothetical protein|nr:hypothetical protein [Pyrinomonadaceae bacterium]
MAKHELKKEDERRDPHRLGDNVDLPAMPPPEPIESDPMHPKPPADADPKRAERPDLDWAEHED